MTLAMRSDDIIESPLAPPPEETPIELQRLRRNVRSQLFGGSPQPTRIGRYELRECIGHGGMGVVWSAWDQELGRTVAIKLLRPELSGRDLGAEARALAQLAHPNVVSVFDMGTHGDQRFFAMEYVQGETLREWLSRPHPVEDVVAMFVEAGRGLAAAHAVGLVHRDFKPDNVLVGEDGRPRVLDFGLARPPGGGLVMPPALPHDADPYATTMTHAGALLGTPAYMAPEQHLGERADARADQFSFGVALYEGLTGALPFAGEDLRTLSLAVVRGRVSFDPSTRPVPPSVRSVIERTLSVSPQARFVDMASLIEALQDALRNPDARFDTRQVDAVLARAAQLEAATTTGRPQLSAGDLEAAAAEAGLSAEHARQAMNEAMAAPPTPGAMAPANIPVPVAAVERAGGGLPMDVRTSRFLALHPTVTTVQLIVRELERLEGRGKAEQLGTSMVWQSPSLEVQLDRRGGGSSLTLLRRFGSVPRRRTLLMTVAGAFVAAAAIIPIFAGILEVLGVEVLIPLAVFACFGWGGYAGRKLAHRLHERYLDRRQLELEHTADRLVALAEANSGL